ncbi:serine/threonine-protein kinase [Spirillospora sp. NPDC047279]|uniref:serine/threonine-protein kinase n=1 Tax=Spirillospora sp. NPDC047279 TaxID=3155478 RepID=UPI0033C4132F
MHGWRVEGFSEVRELGRGAQGRVVLAKGADGGGTVAIKYLAPALLADGGRAAAFRRETEALARAASPHVALLHRYVEEAGGAAIVMEAVTGASLRDVLDRHGALPPESALAVFKGSLLGLSAAHALGVVHRDHKPANVVVRPDGVTTLIDFGVTLLTGQSDRSGTPSYLAPEQWRGEPASPATDIYAAACVFFECATGTAPFRATSLSRLRYQHLTQAVPLAEAPAPVRPLLERGLAKTPGRRAWDAAGLVTELETIAVAAYGPGWEDRGARALGEVAAVLAAAFPAAMLGSFGSTGGTGLGAGALADLGAGTLGRRPTGEPARPGAARGGGLRKPGSGARTVVVAFSAVTAIGAATAGAVVLGRGGTDTETAGPPTMAAGASSVTSAPDVGGGTATGTFRIGFRAPGSTGAPGAAYALSARPARVAAGATLTATLTASQRRVPEGDGRGGYRYTVGSGGITLYPVPPARPGVIPSGDGIRLGSGTAPAVTIPRDGRVKPGRYLVSPFGTPRVTGVTIRGRRVPPESVGAYTEGSLPLVTVLPGAVPTRTARPPAGAGRGPSACRTTAERMPGKIRPRRAVC